VLFTSDVDPDDGTLTGCEPTTGLESAKWFAAITDEPGECYVTCLDLIPTRGVKFAGGNSWRGDHFEPELRKAIESMQSSGSIRCGPFGVPTK
jgi:hypothetical protein